MKTFASINIGPFLVVFPVPAWVFVGFACAMILGVALVIGGLIAMQAHYESTHPAAYHYTIDRQGQKKYQE